MIGHARFHYGELMDGRQPVVLVIEANESARDLIIDVLGAAGYAVEAVGDGAAALSRLEPGGVDLVLLDLALPGMSGLDLCRRMRSRPAEQHVPVVVCTAMSGSAYHQAAIAAGADDYLPKPFELKELLATVARHCR